MTDVLFEYNGLRVLGFWGGKARGRSLVFVQGGTQVELAERTATYLLKALLDRYSLGAGPGKNRLFQVTHSHRHGISTYLVMADKEPSEEALIKALEIDYEPEREETLEVEEITQITEL